MGHLDSQRSLPAMHPDQTGLSPLAKKLRLTADHSVAMLNAPSGMSAQIVPGPKALATDLRPNEMYDAVVLFVNNAEELRRLGPGAIRATGPGGLLWIAYPKGGPARGATDLPATPWWVQRDVLGEVTSVKGYKPVSFVAVDENWTALRFKPV
jgi:hypothetical protein